jgi:hypothetical protein
VNHVNPPARTPPIRNSKLVPVTTNPSIAEVRAPAVTTGESENRIEISTYTAKAGETSTIYGGDRMWAKVTLTARTAGPVAVGQQARLAPVLSGRGQLLQTGVPTVFNVPKGNKLYIIADATTPVSMVVEAYPWLETITGLVSMLAGVIRAPVAAAADLVRSASGKIG